MFGAEKTNWVQVILFETNTTESFKAIWKEIDIESQIKIVIVTKVVKTYQCRNLLCLFIVSFTFVFFSRQIVSPKDPVSKKSFGKFFKAVQLIVSEKKPLPRIFSNSKLFVSENLFRCNWSDEVCIVFAKLSRLWDKLKTVQETNFAVKRHMSSIFAYVFTEIFSQTERNVHFIGSANDWTLLARTNSQRFQIMMGFISWKAVEQHREDMFLMSTQVAVGMPYFQSFARWMAVMYNRGNSNKVIADTTMHIHSGR